MTLAFSESRRFHRRIAFFDRGTPDGPPQSRADPDEGFPNWVLKPPLPLLFSETRRTHFQKRAGPCAAMRKPANIYRSHRYNRHGKKLSVNVFWLFSAIFMELVNLPIGSTTLPKSERYLFPLTRIFSRRSPCPADRSQGSAPHPRKGLKPLHPISFHESVSKGAVFGGVRGGVPLMHVEPCLRNASTGVPGDCTAPPESALGKAGTNGYAPIRCGLYTALLWENRDRIARPSQAATSRVVHSGGKLGYIFRKPGTTLSTGFNHPSKISFFFLL